MAKKTQGLPAFPSGPKPPSLPRELRPFKPPPPEVKVPKISDEADELQARWDRWRSRREGHGTGSILEFICWEYLVLKKKQILNVDFIYQFPLLGGRTQFGGFVADFYFPLKYMVWNPAGLRFHQTQTRDRARDLLARTILANKGIRLIYLYEDDLLSRPDFTLNKAWEGIQVSHV